MKGFVLQVQDDGHYSVDTATVAEAIKERNWLRPDEQLLIVDCRLEDLYTDMLSDMVPVGSVEFVNRALELWGRGPMKPINIPVSLRDDYYVHRKIDIVHSPDDILRLMEQWKSPSVFLKDNTRVKSDMTGVYTSRDRLFDADEYFVSEPRKFVSEWRCFVYRGRGRGIKHYLGDPWLMPNRQFVENCIDAIGDTLTAYTLDVGILPDGNCAVIEVHNFVSCGLYGFESTLLVPMLINGYLRELYQP